METTEIIPFRRKQGLVKSYCFQKLSCPQSLGQQFPTTASGTTTGLLVFILSSTKFCDIVAFTVVLIARMLCHYNLVDSFEWYLYFLYSTETMFYETCFLLIVMSEIESTRSTQYTPLYENKQFESTISQWRLLFQRIAKLKNKVTYFICFSHRLRMAAVYFDRSKSSFYVINIFFQ